MDFLSSLEKGCLGLTFGVGLKNSAKVLAFWTGIKDYTTWNLLYIDYSTYPAQLECSSHESSTLQHDQLSSSL